MAFTYRLEKGSPLTEQELDDNFRGVANIAQTTADEINKKVTADTNEAKRQANEAAKQALKAKGEADRASQITGLDTVADAIGLAAVPFPDVWIPFNDSLRMLAGFGRDVKVGSDVVATYVNYERATTATYTDKSGVLRTAAINEPRFEKEGLLIEGQSTNAFSLSAVRGFSWVSAGITQSAGTAAAPLDYGFQRTLTSSTYSADATERSIADLYALPIPSGSGAATISAFLVGNADAIIATQPEIFAAPAGSGILRSVKRINGSLVRITYTAEWSASVNKLDNLQIRWTNSIPSVVLAGYQIEALPFASSYIPTNGAAVTRAADKCWIRATGNIPANLNCMTQAAAIDILGKGISSWPRLVELNHPADRGALVSMVDGSWGGASLPVAVSGSAKSNTLAVARYEDGRLFNDGQAGGTFSMYSSIADGDMVYIAGYPSVPTRRFFGHIRNLRIWHHALSDAQIKGLK